jgi:hypothetical protein
MSDESGCRLITCVYFTRVVRRPKMLCKSGKAALPSVTDPPRTFGLSGIAIRATMDAAQEPKGIRMLSNVAGRWVPAASLGMYSYRLHAPGRGLRKPRDLHDASREWIASLPPARLGGEAFGTG